MIDSKSRVCYTKNILAELQKSEEDTMNYRSVKISEDARISKQSVLAVDVTMGRDSCVFYFAVIRGDEAPVVIGDESNIQADRSLHTEILLPSRGVAASGFPPLCNIPHCCLP